MREEYGSLPMSIHDEGFGDMGFDDADFIRDDPNIDVSCFYKKKKRYLYINFFAGTFIGRRY